MIMKRNQNIEQNDWLVKGISNEQLELEDKLVTIAAQIYLKRIGLGMDQKAFAKHMGVTQGLVSRWESGSYNFSIATLNSICVKLGLLFEPKIFEEIKKPSTATFDFEKNNSVDSQDWNLWKPQKEDIILGGMAS